MISLLACRRGDARLHGGSSAPHLTRGPLSCAAFVLVVVLVVLCSFTVASSAALVLPDSGVTLGGWSDATATYFGSSSVYVHANGTTEAVAAPPLRVLALTDWQSQRRTEFLGSWPNRTSATLWANRDLATSLVSRTRAAALLFHAVWSTESLPASQRQSSDAAVTIVSAAGVDLLGRGDADVLLQGSDGVLYVLNHSSVSGWTSSTAFSRAAVGAANTAGEPVTTAMKMPAAPSVSVVPDFMPTNATAEAVQAALVFVNADDQLVLLSRVADTAWPPQYTPSVLVDEQSAQTQRAVLPLSVVSADVNEDCAAELLYAVRDSRQRLFEVHLLNTAALTDAAESSGTPLLQLSEDSGERYGETFTVADVNGDGLPELILAVQLANESGSCAAADTAGWAEMCTPYHAVRIFYPTRASGLSGSATCRPASSSSDHHVTYDMSKSELFALTRSWCGVAGWASDATGSLPLYMPSYPSSPLVLRPGDYNRDRLVDLVVPSSYGPLLLTSRAVGGGAAARPVVCTALDASAGQAALAKATAGTSASAPQAAAYRTATPFFATMGLLGRLEIVLTHHRVLASTEAPLALHQVQVYQNSEVPSRSYFLSATASTMRSYGAGCVGATHHMTWQDIHMRSHLATLTQQGRTAAHALLPPHMLVGLDETFSYVHDYTIGLRVAGRAAPQLQTKEWPSYLVPNAQVFAEVFPVQKPAKWTLQLYLPTSTYRLRLVAALAVALAVIGLPVVWLRCGEMKHDYNEWRMP